ncbi:MAG: ATP-binding protein [Gaiellaceae bacterium]
MWSALEVVGRESEIDSVHDFLEVVSGGPIALLIEGGIGMGKTTVWRKRIAEAGERGLQVLASRPVQAEIALPFAVLGDLHGDVPDAALGRLPDPQREALKGALLRVGTKPGGQQRRAVALGVLGAIRVLPRTRRWSWRSTTCNGSTHLRPMPSHSQPGDCATNRSASSSRDARRRPKNLASSSRPLWTPTA